MVFWKACELIHSNTSCTNSNLRDQHADDFITNLVMILKKLQDSAYCLEM